MTIGRMSERDAEKARLALWLQLNGLDDAPGEPEPLTWQRFVDDYLEAKRPELARASIREARNALKQFREAVAPTYLADADRAMVEKFKAKRLADCADATVRKDVRTLRAAFAWAVEMGHLETNPAEGVRFGRRTKKVRPEVLSLEDTDRLIAAVDKRPTWLQASVRLAARWGLRCGELAALERADVDFRHRLVHIQPKETWTPKGGWARAVPLDEDTAGLLHELSHRDGPLLWGPPDDPFNSADGDRGYKRKLRDALRHLYAALGIPQPRKPVHMLRATAETNMRRRGVPAHIRLRIIGHTATAVGDRHYDGSTPEEVARQAAEYMRRGG
jgi:integrase